MARHERPIGPACHHAAGQPAPGVGGLSREEFCVLTIARYFFQSFADPRSEGWTRAMTGAEGWLGREAAPGAVFAVFNVIQQMRRARRSCFRFSNPDCAECAAQLCAHERLWLNTCRALVRGRPEEAAAHAMILCEGNDTAPFLDEMARLARLVPGLEPMAQSPTQ